MVCFELSQMDTLKEYIFNSFIHDAKIEHIDFNFEQSICSINIVNQFNNVKYLFVFENIDNILFAKGNWHGKRNEILSLTLENETLSNNNAMYTLTQTFCDSLYLLFQMFSGDEIHIISKKVSIGSQKISNDL